MQEIWKEDKGECLVELDVYFSMVSRMIMLEIIKVEVVDLRFSLRVLLGDRLNRAPRVFSGGQGHNKFYALHARLDMDGTLDVLDGIFFVFHFDVYALVDLGALLFVTLWVPITFDIHPKILLQHFSVYTPNGDLVLTKRDYRNCSISFLLKVTSCDFVDLK